MGLVGGYDLNLYCDHPEHKNDGGQLQPSFYYAADRNDAFKKARKNGWIISPYSESFEPKTGRGFCLCPDHNRCFVDGCLNKPSRRGYCNKHRLRIQRYGNPNVVKNIRYKKDDICRVYGCYEPPKARGLCKGHYSRLIRTGGVVNMYGDTKLARRHLCSQAP